MVGAVEPLLVIRASDGSALMLGEDPADRERPFRLVFQHEGHGAPEPVRGPLCVLWVTIDNRPHIVFAGNSLDEPGVDRVLVDLPDHTQSCPLRPAAHNPRIWMSFPEPFQRGMVATAWWLGGDRVYHTERTPPLERPMRAPEPPPPPPEMEPQQSPSPEDPAGWTWYAPG